MFTLDGDLKYTWKAKPKDPVQRRSWSCMAPHQRFSIDYKGRVFVCHDCWVPFPVGTMSDFKDIGEIFNSPVAKKIQSFTKPNTNFKFCDTKTCGIQFNNSIGDDMVEIHLGLDQSCNLRCPSCRTELIYIKAGKEYEERIASIDKFIGWLENYDKPLRIIVGANGDAFASHVYQYFYNNYKPNPKHNFFLKTNGLKITDLENISFLSQVRVLQVSIDAGSKAVYEKVRLGGRWEKLIENLNFVKDHNVSTRLFFVLQKDNLHDVKNFVKLCRDYEFKGAITGLENWGTWTTEHFLNQRVHLPQDALYNDWMSIKSNIKTNSIEFNNV